MLVRIPFILLIFYFGYGYSQDFEIKKQGKASFYADKFVGRKTANGETFSNNDFTAAHKSLPFNSLVRVTNPENNKTTVVRINDRGPHIKGRVIDLSKAAAKKIGLDFQGFLPVVILLPETTLLTPEIESTFRSHRYSDCLGNEDQLGGITIQIWKTINLQHILFIANDLDDIQKKGKVIIERKGNMFVLLISNLHNKIEADEVITHSQKEGFFKSRFYE